MFDDGGFTYSDPITSNDHLRIIYPESRVFDESRHMATVHNLPDPGDKDFLYVVGTYHTHPRDAAPGFSDTDLAVVQNEGLLSYLAEDKGKSGGPVVDGKVRGRMLLAKPGKSKAKNGGTPTVLTLPSTIYPHGQEPFGRNYKNSPQCPSDGRWKYQSRWSAQWGTYD